MIIYRFAHPKYALDISGTGARIRGGRWNPPGVAVTYASEHISLALLEILVNTATLEELNLIQLVEIQLPDTISQHEVTLSALKKGWQHDFEYTQWMGKEMLQNSRSLLIRCPSAVIPSEHNLLINPLHADFRKLKPVTARGFDFDERLFKRSAAAQKNKAAGLT
ncbi:RES family NAD+ phosphorylase [Sediminibacterium soli]|uniref:RES family NAD+ phosphorylase n=1 Tax=Sediminibacterium soli TaxID=2698829 RepID=UPI00137A7162|nr:RES family NAD+ phosphorylase [Sediminibacterium soli]NCI45966.1 RES domain-containing protein [Sediminibacterium soli]